MRNYSVRTVFKCPTRGEISEVVGRRKRALERGGKGKKNKDGNKIMGRPGIYGEG